MAAKVDTEQLINVAPEEPEDSEEEQEEEEQSDLSDEGIERAEADGNSDEEGGVDPEPAPPLGIYDQVAPEVDNNKDKPGTFWQKCGRAVKACLIGCCHDCKTMDKVLFVFHILVIAVGLAVGIVTSLSKISTHNQCYLKAHYHPDGSMDYSQELYWCDSLLYDALVTMSLGFLFIMVNWTAQLNKNNWWMWIKLALHVSGWLLQVVSGIMLLIAFFSWCTSMQSAMSADEDLPVNHNKTDNKCLRAARYFDEDKNEESTLTNLYSFTLISLGIALLAALLWTVTLGLQIAHFCEHLYRKQDEHTEGEDDYHLDDDDSEEDDDEEEGYRYPPYEPNLVRRRVGGGYDVEDEGAAVGGAANGGPLRDVAA